MLMMIIMNATEWTDDDSDDSDLDGCGGGDSCTDDVGGNESDDVDKCNM